jgi:alpha-ribazole phosphatase/probable phosphoglycerate mutase
MTYWPPAPGTTRLVLVRHAEPDETFRGRCYGRLDVGLSPRGREQAERVALALAGAPIDAIVSSPRHRAVETARPIARALGLGEPALAHDLREIDFGVFEGLTYDEAAARHPDVYEAWMKRATEVTFPGGESFTMVRRRVRACAASLRAAHVGRSIAIVAHGGTHRTILAEALRIADADIFRLDQAHAAVSVVDWIEDTAIVRVMNWRAG